MLWELLVTPGHVRGARLKRVLLPFTVFGVVLALVGLYLTASQPRPPHALSGVIGVAGRIERLKNQVSAAFDSARPLRLKVAELHELPSGDEIPDIRIAVRDALNKNDQLPDTINFEVMPADRFWSFAWPLNRIAVTRNQTVIALGAVVSRDRTQEPGRPSNYSELPNSDAPRWLAIYRKTKNGWSTVDIQRIGFFVPAGTSGTAPNAIPESLRLTMNIPEL